VASKTSKLSTNNLIALATLVVAIMIVLLVIVGRGFLKDITHNSTVIGKKQKAESQLKQNISALPGLTSAYQNLGSTKDLIASALPTQSDFPGLVATMEAIAGTSGVSLQGVAPQTAAGTAIPTAGAAAPTTSPSAAIQSINNSTVSASGGAADTGPQPYAFTITVKGSYTTIISFLSNLQLSARPIKVTDVQLSGTTPALSGTIIAQTYSYNPAVLQDKTEVVK